jgi:hypothetical protein
VNPIKILDVWISYFDKLLNVDSGEQTDKLEIHTAEQLIPEPSVTEIEIAIKKLKSVKSPGIDDIPAELLKAGGTALINKLLKLICAVWKEEKHPPE